MTHRWKAIFAAVALFTLPIEAEAQSNCGGNCPGGCTSCPCGTSPSFQSISAWCAKFTGWSQAPIEMSRNGTGFWFAATHLPLGLEGTSELRLGRVAADA